MFEQAYFVLSESAGARPPLYDDMVAEANRIIDENMIMSGEERLSFFGRIKAVIKRSIVPFIIGGVLCSLITAVLFVIIWKTER